MAGYNGDARSEVNQSFEYVGKSVPLLKRHPCEHLSSMTSTHPFHPVPPVERLHISLKRTALKLCFSLETLSLVSDVLRIYLCQKKTNFFPRQWRIGRRLSPFQVALGHSSVNAVKATVGGWDTGSSTCSTFPFHSHTSSARREATGYHLHEHRRLTAEEKRTQQI